MPSAETEASNLISDMKSAVQTTKKDNHFSRLKFLLPKTGMIYPSDTIMQSDQKEEQVAKAIQNRQFMRGKTRKSEDVVAYNLNALFNYSLRQVQSFKMRRVDSPEFWTLARGSWAADLPEATFVQFCIEIVSARLEYRRKHGNNGFIAAYQCLDKLIDVMQENNKGQLPPLMEAPWRVTK